MSAPVVERESSARPLFSLAAVFALGALVGSESGRGTAAVLLGHAAFLLVLALRSRRLALLALGGAALAVGAAAAGVETEAFRLTPLGVWAARLDEADTIVRIEGTAAEDLPADAQDLVVPVDVESVALLNGTRRVVSGRLRLRIGGTSAIPDIGAGDRIAAPVSFGSLRGLRNPGTVPRDVELQRAGVVAVATCKSGQLLAVSREADGGPLAWATAARRWARDSVRRNVPPGPEQALVRAMLLGDRTGLDRETADAFRIAGTYHVLALSGAQVALLAGLLIGLARLARLGPLGTAGMVSAALAFYCAFVGGQPPVTRAVIMAVVLVGGRALDLDADLANLLGLAAGILLLVHPAAIWDVSFQLSFAATLGLLLLTDVVRGTIPVLPWGTASALAASVSAQAALLPFLATHFHRLAPAALVLNLVAVPLSGAVLLAGLAVLVTAAFLPPLAPLAGKGAWAASRLLLLSGEVVRDVPFLDVRVPTPLLSASLFYFATLLLLAHPGCRRRALPLALLATLNLVCGRTPVADGRLRVTMLDVGQGDAFLLQSPSGRALLIDTGGSLGGRFDFGERVLGPALWDLGLTRLDRLVLTHGHPDHVGAAPFLVGAFRVGEVWEGPAPVRDPLWAQVDQALRTAGVRRLTVVRGVADTWDGVRLFVLSPSRLERAPWRTNNDHSLVVLVEFGTVRLLFTGDVESAAEAALPAEPVTVLKVPHHGSRTSSTPGLLARTSPRAALLSVGGRNRFGHPHPEVVARYRRAGIRLFRTDRDGAVVLATDGARVEVICSVPGCETRLP